MLASARVAFLALIVSLAVPRLGIPYAGATLSLTEALFTVAAGCWVAALLRGETRLKVEPGDLPILGYVGLLLVATVAAGTLVPERIAILGYSAALALLASRLAAGQVERAARRWLWASAIPAGVGVLALALFVFGIRLDYALHPFGTLAPGPYPRLQSTFAFPAMLCTYLTVSVLLLLHARRAGWIGRGKFLTIGGASAITALYCLTPGLGGLALAIGGWLTLSDGRSRWWLAGGAAALAGSVVAAALTPVAHPSAHWSIEMLGHPFYPAVRWLAWSDALRLWAAHPLVGTGLTGGPVSVDYLDPGGAWHNVTDAHDVYLNIAAQTGLVGLAGLALLIGWVTVSLRGNGLGATLALAWLAAFAAEGLTGSYEDARHLWVLLGLVAAARRSDRLADQPSGQASERVASRPTIASCAGA
ncbi:hypothetical protein ABDK56_04625 [Sphingomonas sp. ASV193]|uniref:hypothetical protein n=1 Tax=Sphingomonas sp. ASV193 TaxID=3144405 RepID=UPI0032E8FD7D